MRVESKARYQDYSLTCAFPTLEEKLPMISKWLTLRDDLACDMRALEQVCLPSSRFAFLLPSTHTLFLPAGNAVKTSPILSDSV